MAAVEADDVGGAEMQEEEGVDGPDGEGYQVVWTSAGPDAICSSTKVMAVLLKPRRVRDVLLFWALGSTSGVWQTFRVFG